ncbi:hypothetical protein HNQ37_000390 [Lactovum miscens]|uniref:Uncharacterized protein n=1 Tax=Lactovum miscens TaxID=190387 RepID=A0A841C7Z4_9LACT|nr:hypothetical protein [Lactovum miscens]
MLKKKIRLCLPKIKQIDFIFKHLLNPFSHFQLYLNHKSSYLLLLK